MADATVTLLILRHAKAEPGIGILDVDRPLADRGRRDAAAMGDHLRAHDLLPDAVLCSTAVRTRQTLACLRLTAPTSFEDRVYGNDEDDLVDLVRDTGLADDPATVLLVGHNPSLHQMVLDVCGEAPETFPTSALAVVDLPSWESARRGGGTLRTVHVARG